MKKMIVLMMASIMMSSVHSSKLSKFFNKMEEKDKARREREWQQDMNFNDHAFRLKRRFTDEHGQSCREYVFRARSNPYRHGQYVVCDSRY